MDMKFGVRAVIISALALPVAVIAQEPQMPRMFKGMGKGQWRMEMLENSEMKKKGSMPAMTICTDNLAKHSADKSAPKAESKCKHRLLKDTADEAVTQISCPDRTVTTTMKRESAKSVLMDIKSEGKGGPRTAKMRYISMGACREGQATMTLDKDSEQCKKMRASMAKMDPATSARVKAMCGG
jgi:hypothetical protein